MNIFTENLKKIDTSINKDLYLLIENSLKNLPDSMVDQTINQIFKIINHIKSNYLLDKTLNNLIYFMVKLHLDNVKELYKNNVPNQDYSWTMTMF